ncbi:MAG: histidine kinase [Solirubrobacterales bacterium]|nr:histidine kinase [Solirubrobacterales bacterium]
MFGLRPRLLAALLATSLVTLGAAAIVLLPPLRDRLRDQSVHATEAAVTSQLAPLNELLHDRPKQCEAVFELASQLGQQIGGDVYVVDTVPRKWCLLLPTIKAGNDLLVQRALNEGIPGRIVRGDDLEIVSPLTRGLRPTEALIVRKRLSDVSGAVGEVYSAFGKAAVIGLAAALILGLVLATTLVRRLGRLRNAALRVTTEGAGAPRPQDEGRDEIGDLARSFAAMQGALQRQEEARRAFVATASHELRTPLTSLSGMLELLGEDLTEGRLDVADAHLQITAARGELRRLGNLAAELLDLSRLDAGLPLRSEPVELGELARAVASEFEQRASDLGVSIDVVPPIGPCWAKADPGAVARILRILVDNALRFSPPGRPIQVIAHYSGERAVVEVFDHGPGVPDSERELIFQRFQRGSRTGGEGGFGLGLAIARELAIKLGGTLELREPDRAHPGARFACALPIEMPSGGPGDPAPTPLEVP